MPDLNTAIEYLRMLAADNRRGYSQIRRNEKLEDDCSSSCLDALRKAGFDVGKASYTGDAYPYLIKAGFTDITSQITKKTGKGLKTGDVGIRPPTKTRGGHMIIMVSDTELFQASGDFDGKRGDSSGKELSIKPYYNSPFKYFLRYNPPQESEPALFAIKLTGDMNIRRGPGKSYAIDHVAIAANTGVLGIAELSHDRMWGRIQNQTNPALWIKVEHESVKRV